MGRLRRLDAELVRRGLARSRGQAADLVSAGRVAVGGATASKPATQVDPAAAIVVRPAPEGEADYVSRGGHKLAGALDAFAPEGLTVGGAAASTPGPAPEASPTSCCGAAPGTSSRSTSATASSRGPCSRTAG